ncbi:unnamed protein product, partial [Brassica oleracea var. botrytis]
LGDSYEDINIFIFNVNFKRPAFSFSNFIAPYIP